MKFSHLRKKYDKHCSEVQKGQLNDFLETLFNIFNQKKKLQQRLNITSIQEINHFPNVSYEENFAELDDLLLVVKYEFSYSPTVELVPKTNGKAHLCKG